jgi:hypothetical protein
MLVFLLVVGLCLPTFAQEEDSHHCHDPEAWTEWQGNGIKLSRDVIASD